MADQKITQLTEDTSPAATDLVVTVDDPGGTPVNKKVEFETIRDQLKSAGNFPLNHDDLATFVANEHVDHTSVSITGGTGLSGGGDISANRTLDLDINGLTEETDVDESADFIPLYDASGLVIRKIKPANIDHDNLAGFVANEHVDHSGVSITAGIGLTGGGDLTATRTVDMDVNSLTEHLTPNENNDFLLLYDTAGVLHRKVKPATLEVAASQISSGTVVHERGGLEADVSAYSGLVKISGGATSQAVAGTDYAAASHNHNASDINAGTLAHERGGVEADISAVAIGDIVAGTGTGTMALVTSTGHNDGDVLTRQADGSVDWETPSGGAVSIEDRVNADVTVVNTVTETNLWSKSVSAMAIGETLEIDLFGDYLNNSGSNKTINIRIKVGSTTLWSHDSSNLGASTNRRGVVMRLIIKNQETQSKQIVGGRISFSPVNSADTGFGRLSGTVNVQAALSGSSTEDWSSALTVSVTAEHSAADANCEIRIRGGIIKRY